MYQMSEAKIKPYLLLEISYWHLNVITKHAKLNLAKCFWYKAHPHSDRLKISGIVDIVVGQPGKTSRLPRATAKLVR